MSHLVPSLNGPQSLMLSAFLALLAVSSPASALCGSVPILSATNSCDYSFDCYEFVDQCTQVVTSTICCDSDLDYPELECPEFVLQAVRESTSGPRSSFEHPEPKLALRVDGVPLPARAVRSFADRSLHFMVNRRALEEGRILAFTSRQELFAALVAGNSWLPDPLRPTPHLTFERGTPGAIVYQEEAASGPSLFLASGQTLDLRGSQWNGKIRSLRHTGGSRAVTLLEGGGWEGSTLTLVGPFTWNTLEIFGWADRASALIVWPIGEPSSRAAQDLR